MKMSAMLLVSSAMMTLGVGSAAAGKEAVNESLSCLSTQTNGSGENLFQTCVSDTGSIPLFRTRQGGGDNISGDGYVICDSQTGGGRRRHEIQPGQHGRRHGQDGQDVLPEVLT